MSMFKLPLVYNVFYSSIQASPLHDLSNIVSASSRPYNISIFNFLTKPNDRFVYVVVTRNYY